MNNINNFMNSAKSLSKNPLGIIALFISLIYAFACALLGVSLNNISEQNERLPLIWFIILFPVVILLAFIYLVVNHHEKLYAPSDYRDDNTFIKAMDTKAIQNKTKIEVKELAEAIKMDPSKEKASISSTTKNSETKSIELDSITLEEKYKNAEKWSLNEFSLKHNLEITKNQEIVSSRFGKFQLDGIAKTEENFYAIEVKYWSKNLSSNSLKIKIQETLRHLNKVKSALTRRNFIPVIIIVMDSTDENIKTSYLNFIKTIDENAQLEIYEYLDLMNKYNE